MNAVIRSLSAQSQGRLRAAGIVFDIQFTSVNDAGIDAIVGDPRDRGAIKAYRRSASPLPAAPRPLPLLPPDFELGDAPTSGVELLDRYAGRRTRDLPDEVSDVPLVRAWETTDGLPFEQRPTDCTSHAWSAALGLYRGAASTTQFPSPRYLHARSGIEGGHKRRDGRSLKEVLEVLTARGWVTERQWPTTPSSEELEPMPAKIVEGAARCRCAGGFVLVDPSSVGDLALDLTFGGILSRPQPLVVALAVHSNWSDAYHLGLIHRHGPKDPLIGFHAVIVLGAFEANGVAWAVLGNSWGTSFGAASPFGAPPGLAITPLDYFGACVRSAALVCETGSELARARSRLREPVPSPRVGVLDRVKVALAEFRLVADGARTRTLRVGRGACAGLLAREHRRAVVQSARGLLHPRRFRRLDPLWACLGGMFGVVLLPPWACAILACVLIVWAAVVPWRLGGAPTVARRIAERVGGRVGGHSG